MKAAQRPAGRVDVPTRYFLRRLAQAQHANGGARAYAIALSDVIAIFVLLPALAVLCIAARLGAVLHALPPPFNAVPALSLALATTLLMVATGHAWFMWRLRGFRHDAALARDFDTEDDRQIAFWQKLMVMVICGFIIPLCALSALLAD